MAQTNKTAPGAIAFQFDVALPQRGLGLFPICELCGDRIEMDRLVSNAAETLCWACATRSKRLAARNAQRAPSSSDPVSLKDRARKARHERLGVSRPPTRH